MKYYRIYLLLLSTVCVNPFLYSSSNLSGCSALMTPPPTITDQRQLTATSQAIISISPNESALMTPPSTISLPLQNNEANILNNINLPQKRKRKTLQDNSIFKKSSSKKTKKDETISLKKKRKKLLETFCEDLPEFSQLELTVFEKKY